MHPVVHTYRRSLSRLYSHAPTFLPGAMRRLARTDAVAVTIDDGPSEEALDGILRACDDIRLRATWFLSGEAVERHPVSAQALLEAGHAIASHGYAHVSPARLLNRRLAEDVERSLRVIENITGRRPALYRPPYGRMRPGQMTIPQQFGCRTVLWSLMPGDWRPEVSVTELRHRLSRLRGGDIIVLHDRSGMQHRLVASLTAIAELCEQKNLTTVVLDQKG
ncbi:MAG: polysaccharide deacetylase family protein [Bacteroidetes bacterium]|nr:polysaccharide deacetylase family protein [Bacteroidota bacterium]